MTCRKCGEWIKIVYIEKYKYVKTAICPSCGTLNSERLIKKIPKGHQE